MVTQRVRIVNEFLGQNFGVELAGFEIKFVGGNF